MNFFEQQDKARRQTRWLLVLFLLAVIAIVVAIDLAVLVGFGMGTAREGEPVVPGELLAGNVPLLAGATFVTLAVIGFSSLFRTMRLRSGGGQVARELGGQAIPSDSSDPLHQRLRNVVEEIALASGVPVPEVYVLEQEQGINAFAAGFTPADAAVTVTRGTLEKLSRNELQGVVAHEFSHIFNGDMRINIRLMGAVFGILVLAVVGRRVLIHARFAGGSRNKNGGAIMLVAVALMLVGYIGLFFGRWIKAAVSRQREYLADASAVQFTRDPDSIGGALKKIAVYSDSSYLAADTEEVGHMLFGAGRKMRMFATHPPIMQRIQRVEPSFTNAELKEFAQRLRKESERRAQAEQEHAEREAKKREAGKGGFDAGGIVQEIGKPGWERMMLAAGIVASLPEAIGKAARSPQWATELLLIGLLDQDTQIREQQLLTIAQDLGAESEERVRQLLRVSADVRAEQRLPLLEMALPMIKQRSQDEQAQLLKVIDRLIHQDGKVDVFEYLVARLISQYLWEAANPRQATVSGRRSLKALAGEAQTVMTVLAMHGNQDDGERERAWRAGMQRLGLPADRLTWPENWVEAMDHALGKLDDLKPEGREVLVQAMIDVATSDEIVSAEEIELMRAVCASLHVPVPVLHPAASD